MQVLELMRPGRERDLGWLKEALQAAVELEFFTLPPYLTAMWSVKDQTHAAVATIRAVAYEEMQHMALGCNMLAAVGGSPRINRPPAVPEYPRPMPGGVKPYLTVGLAGLSQEAVKVFLLIEEPEKVQEFEEAGFEEALGVTFPRIGAFYDEVERVFYQVNPRLSVDRQITGPLAPMLVATPEDVGRAIEQIRVQGEGRTDAPTEEPGGDLAHYYRFLELQRERKLEYYPDVGKHRWGAKLPFPEAYPVATVPTGGYRYDEVEPQVAALLRQFDEAYTRLLDELQSAWGGGGQGALWRAVEWMFALQEPARALMALPIPGTEKPALHYGPNFRYLGGR